MNTVEAIAAAKKYVAEVYADEHVSNLGMDEVEPGRSAGHWVVTLAFSRP